MQNLLMAAIILTVFAYLYQIFVSTMMIRINPPILGGIVAGLVFGDVGLGLYIGTILTLMSLGLYTYGGTKVPNYFLGSILGTAVAALMLRQNPGMAQGEAINVAIATIAVPASMLGMALSSIVTMVCTTMVQWMDAKAGKGDAKGFDFVFYLTLLLTNGPQVAIPVFLGVIMGDKIVSMINIFPESLMGIFGIAGGLMPLLGFGLLLTMIDIKRYWPYLLGGYFLISYTGTSVIGLSIAASAIVGVSYMAAKDKKQETGLQGGEKYEI